MSLRSVTKDTARKALAGCIFLAWVGSLIGFASWAWFSQDGSLWLKEVWNGTIRGETVSPVGFTRNSIVPMLSFVGIYITIMFFCMLVVNALKGTEKSPLSPQMKALLRAPLLKFNLQLLSIALIEETLFRWFPLAALITVFPNEPKFVSLVISVSCVLFGLLHLFNYPADKRSVILILPQIVGGFFLAYAYLKWSFAGAVFVHYFYNLSLLIGLKYITEIHPNILEVKEERIPERAYD